jgi:hypothetical protein
MYREAFLKDSEVPGDAFGKSVAWGQSLIADVAEEPFLAVSLFPFVAVLPVVAMLHVVSQEGAAAFYLGFHVSHRESYAKPDPAKRCQFLYEGGGG